MFAYSARTTTRDDQLHFSTCALMMNVYEIMADNDNPPQPTIEPPKEGNPIPPSTKPPVPNKPHSLSLRQREPDYPVPRPSRPNRRPVVPLPENRAEDEAVGRNRDTVLDHLLSPKWSGESETGLNVAPPSFSDEESPTSSRPPSPTSDETDSHVNEDRTDRSSTVASVDCPRRTRRTEEFRPFPRPSKSPQLKALDPLVCVTLPRSEKNASLLKELKEQAEYTREVDIIAVRNGQDKAAIELFQKNGIRLALLDDTSQPLKNRASRNKQVRFIMVQWEQRKAARNAIKENAMLSSRDRPLSSSAFLPFGKKKREPVDVVVVRKLYYNQVLHNHDLKPPNYQTAPESFQALFPEVDMGTNPSEKEVMATSAGK